MVVGNGRDAVPTGQPMSQDEFGPPLRVENLDSPAGITTTHAEARLGLLKDLDRDFLAQRPGVPVASHLSAYERAVRLMRAKGSEAFDLDEEPRELRLKYGRTQFGQGCLLARRLIERGVPFVEVSLAGGQPLAWDTHVDNFKSVTSLSETLDAGWSALVDDLKDRGMLDSTLIVWMGEFGRTPKINPNNGRDHFPLAWSTVLMGGGIHGGQAIGKTAADGMSVVERPVVVGDFLATICRGLGIDPTQQNVSNVGRPDSHHRSEGFSHQRSARMSVGRRFLCVAVVAACALIWENVSARAIAQQAKGAQNGDVQDLLYLAPKRPIVIRMHIRVDGQPLTEMRTAIARAIFDVARRGQ